MMQNLNSFVEFAWTLQAVWLDLYGLGSQGRANQGNG